jgi:plasmid replication initiation protein
MAKKKNQIVKESNALARARLMPTSGSVWDERVIAALAGRNRTDDCVFAEHVIDIKELATSSEEFSASQLTELTKAITRLTRSYFQISKGKDFMNYPIFAKIGLDGNKLVGRFNSALKEHYLELKKQFAIRYLPEFKALSGTYSQRLFRFLNSWKDQIEIQFPLNELHEILMTPPSFRQNFKAFRIRVLETAHRDIVSNTGLVYAWEPIKQGQRKVVAVRFIFNLERAALVAKGETQVQQEAENIFELQRLSNQCFERLKRLKHPCEPKKSKKCDYCTTRGRMYAQKIVEQSQGNLPFEPATAQTDREQDAPPLGVL